MSSHKLRILSAGDDVLLKMGLKFINIGFGRYNVLYKHPINNADVGVYVYLGNLSTDLNMKSVGMDNRTFTLTHNTYIGKVTKMLEFDKRTGALTSSSTKMGVIIKGNKFYSSILPCKLGENKRAEINIETIVFFEVIFANIYNENINITLLPIECLTVNINEKGIDL